MGKPMISFLTQHSVNMRLCVGPLLRADAVHLQIMIKNNDTDSCFITERAFTSFLYILFSPYALPFYYMEMFL